MRPDASKIPYPKDGNEIIPADAEMRRSRKVFVQVYSGGGRMRIKGVDTYARQRLELSARDDRTGVPTAVTPRMGTRAQIGEIRVLHGVTYRVDTVCGCSPYGWTRLVPERLAGDEDARTATPVVHPCTCGSDRVYDTGDDVPPMFVGNPAPPYRPESMYAIFADKVVRTPPATDLPGAQPGRTVQILYAGDVSTVRLVIDRSDPDDVTADSPLGRAILGKQPGERFTVTLPDGRTQTGTVMHVQVTR